MKKSVLLIMLSIVAALLSVFFTGCQETKVSDKEARLVVVENMRIKEDLNQKDKQIKQLEEKLEQKEQLIAECQKEKEVLEQQLSEKTKEQTETYLMPIMEQNAELLKEIDQLKEQIQQLKK